MLEEGATRVEGGRRSHQGVQWLTVEDPRKPYRTVADQRGYEK